jgi:hypothetical protein
MGDSFTIHEANVFMSIVLGADELYHDDKGSYWVEAYFWH